VNGQTLSHRGTCFLLVTAPLIAIAADATAARRATFLVLAVRKATLVAEAGLWLLTAAIGHAVIATLAGIAVTQSIPTRINKTAAFTHFLADNGARKVPGDGAAIAIEERADAGFALAAVATGVRPVLTTVLENALPRCASFLGPTFATKAAASIVATLFPLAVRLAALTIGTNETIRTSTVLGTRMAVLPRPRLAHTIKTVCQRRATTALSGTDRCAKRCPFAPTTLRVNSTDALFTGTTVTTRNPGGHLATRTGLADSVNTLAHGALPAATNAAVGATGLRLAIRFTVNNAVEVH